MFVMHRCTDVRISVRLCAMFCFGNLNFYYLFINLLTIQSNCKHYKKHSVVNII